VALALAAVLGTAVAPAQTASPNIHPATPAASVRPQAAATPAPRGEEEKGEAKPDNAGHQGIKIHGHWKIDIKNPDGSLVKSHEFENSLVDEGVLFTYLLTSRATSGEAAIALQAPTYYQGICANTCTLTESSTGYWSNTGNCVNSPSSCSFNLTVTPTITPDPKNTGYYIGTVVMSGSFVAALTGQIGYVETLFASCITGSNLALAAVTPAQCHTGTAPTGSSVNNLPGVVGGELTGTQVTDPSGGGVVVSSGQTIQVTVTLSFT
jgi:hypothetical protein